MKLVLKKLKFVKFVTSLLALSLFVLSGCSFDYSITDLSLEDKLEVKMSSPQRSITDSEIITIDVEFNKNISGLKPENFQVAGGTVVAVTSTGNGKSYQLTVETNGAGGAGIDKEVVEVILLSQNLNLGNGNSQTIEQAEMTFIVDTVRPSVTISTSEISPTNKNPLAISVSFDEKVQGLSAMDFEVVGGGAFISGLTGDGTNYNLTLSPVISGPISIKLRENKIKDLAGNLNTASNDLLITYDINIPIPFLSLVGTSPTNSSSLNFEVNFMNPVTGLDASDFVVVNGSVTNLTGPVSNKYIVTVSPTADGLVSINLPAGVLNSILGSANLASNTASVLVDRVPPTLILAGPTPSIGNKDTKFIWTVDYSGETVIDLTGKIIIAGTSTAGCAVSAISTTGTSQRTIEISGCTGEGSMNIQIAVNSAQDLAGNQAPASVVSSNATIKNSGPILNITGPTNSPGKKSSSFVWILTYSGHNNITLSDSDVALVASGVSNCTKSVSASGNPRTVTITNCDGDGTVGFNVAAGTAVDTVGNLAAANTSAVPAIVDNTAPTLVIGAVNPAIGNSSSVFSWVLTYGGATSVSLVPANITLTNIASTAGCNISVTNPVGVVNRTVELTGCTTNGQVGISVAAGTGSDDAGNLAPAVSSASLATINSSSFSLTLASTENSTNNLSSIPVTVEFSGNATGFTQSDLTLTNATVTGFTTVSGTSYTFNLIPSSDGVVSVVVPAGSATNDFGTTNIVSNTLSFNIDRVKPTLSFVGPTPTLGNKDAVIEWVVNYTGANSAILLDSSFITLGGTAAASCGVPTVVDNGANSKKVSVTNCTGNGSLNISVSAGSAKDLAENFTDAAGPSANATIDNSAPTFTLVGTDVSVGNSTKEFTWQATYGASDTVLLDSSFVVLETTGTVTCGNKTSTGSGTSRTIGVSNCTGDGTVNVKILQGSSEDTAGNTAAELTSIHIATVDNTAPTYVIGAVSPVSGNNTTDFKWNITYSGQQNINLDVNDITIVPTGSVSACAKSVSASGNPRVVTISNCSGEGSVSFNLAANTAVDTAGNLAIAGTSDAGLVDNLGPSVQITGPVPPAGNDGTDFVWTVNFTDADSVSLSAVSFIGTATADCSAVITGSGNSSRTVTVSNCSGTGTVGIVVANDVATDVLGNKSLAASSNLATIDNDPPTIFIGTPAPTIGKNTTTFEWNVVYTGATTISLVAANVQLTGAATGCTPTVTNIDSVTYKISVTGCTADGSLGMGIAAGTAADSVNNLAAAATGASVTIDNTAPIMTISAGTPTDGNSTTSFSWDVTYDAGSIIPGNFTDYVSILVSGNVASCSKTITANGLIRTVTLTGCTGNGQLGFNILAASATDAAGNTALAGSSDNVNVDNLAPTLALSGPTPTAGNNTTEFIWNAVYSGASSISLANSDVQLTGVSVGCTKTVTNVNATTYEIKVTGCTGDGTLNMSVASGTAIDAAGNSALGASGGSVTLDNDLPTISISAGAPLAGKAATTFVWDVTYTGVTAITLAAGDVQLTGASAGCGVTITSPGSDVRRISVTGCTGNGTLNLAVVSGTGRDAVNNLTPGASGASVTVDNIAPTITIGAGAPLTGKSSTVFAWEVIYSGASFISLVPGDVQLSGANADCDVTIDTVDAVTRHILVTGCSGNGVLGLAVTSGSASDAANNFAPAASGSDVNVDNTAPTMTIAAPTPTTGKSSTTFTWAVTYAGHTTKTLTVTDVTVTGVSAGCAAAVTSINANTSNVTVTGCTGNGTMGISIAAGTAADAVGNTAAAGTGTDVTLDNTAPTMSIAAPTPTTGKSSTTFTWAVTYAGHTTKTLVAGNVSVTGANAGCTPTVTSVDGNVSNVTVTGCTGNGAMGISIVAGTAADAVGNTTAAGTGANVTLDNTAPTMTIAAPTPTTGKSSTTFTWAVTYAGHTAKTLAAGDVTVTGVSAGCTAAVTSINANTSNVTVTGCTGNGAMGISIAAGTATDAVGNLAALGTGSNVTLDNTAPTMTIAAPTPTTGKSSTTFTWAVTYAGHTAKTLVAGNVSVTGANAGCTPTVTSVDGNISNVTVTGCTGNGAMGISIIAGTASDDAGNVAAAGTGSDVIVDNVAPIMTIAAPSPTSGSSSTTFTWAVTYSGHSSISLVAGDVNLTGAATAGCTKTVGAVVGSTVNVNVTGCTGNGSMGISIAAATAVDAAGNQANSGTGTNVTVDNTAPTMTIAAPTPTTGRSSTTFTWAVTYAGHTAKTLAAGDVTVTGVSAGCTAAVTSINANTSNVTVTGCTGNGAMGISIVAGTAQDNAGNPANSGTGANVTLDNTAPTMTIAAPTPTTGNSSTTFTWAVTYSGHSSISLAAANVTVTGSANIGCTKSVGAVVGSTVNVTVTGCIGNGPMGISIAAGTASDSVGNTAGSGLGADVTVDNIAPTMTIAAPTPATGKSSTTFTWAVTYSGQSSISLAAADVTVTGATAGCTKAVGAPVGSTVNVTVSGCTGNGAMGISIVAATAQDAAGNTVNAGTGGNVTLDNTAPTMTIAAPTPATGKSSTTFTWAVTYSGQSSISLAAADVTVTGATAGCTKAVGAPVGSTVNVTVTGCTGNGAMGISIAAGTAVDSVGNAAAAGTGADVILDNTAPTMTIAAPTPTTGNSSTTFTWAVTYSGHSSISLAAANVTLTGAANIGCIKSVGAVVGSTVNVTATGCIGNGLLGIFIAAGTAADAAGNTASSGSGADVTVDNIAPVLSIAAPNPTTGNSSTTFTWAVSYTGHSAITLAVADVTVTGANAGCTKAVGAVVGSTVNVTVTGCTGNGAMGISIASGTAVDTAGNPANSGTGSNVTVDNTAPSMSIAAPTPTSGSSSTTFTWAVTYSGHTSISLVAGNVSLTGSATAGCTKAVGAVVGSTVNVTVSGCTGNGALGISIVSGTAVDAAGNQANSGTGTDVTVDNTAPTMSIAAPTPATGNSSATFTWAVTYSGHSSISLVSGNVTVTGTSGGCSKAVGAVVGSTVNVTVTGCTGNGNMGISIAAGTAADAAGNTAASGTGANVAVDNTAPTMSIAAGTPLIGNSSTNFIWDVTYSGHSAISLALANISISGATAGCTVGVSLIDASTRRISVTGCTGDGSLAVTVAAGTAQDTAGNSALGGTGASVTVDNTPPTITLASGAPASGNSATSFTWDVTYPAGSAIKADLINYITVNMTGTVASCTKAVTASGLTRTITITNCAGDGLVGVTVATGSATDGAGNNSVAATSNNLTVDNAPPTISIANGSPTSGTSATTFSWVVTYSNYSTANLVNANITPQSSGGTVTCSTKNVTGSAPTFTVSLSNCTGAGQLSFTIAAGTAQDTLGNLSASATSNSVTVTAASSITTALTIYSGDPTSGDFSTTFWWLATFTGASSYPISKAHVELIGATLGCQITVEQGWAANERWIGVWGCEGEGSLAMKLKTGAALDSGGNPSAESSTSPTVTLTGNKRMVRFSDYKGNSTVSGATNSINIPVRMNLTSSENVTVKYQIVEKNTTAISGTDHNLTNGTVVIPAGQLTTNINFNYNASSNLNRSIQLAITGVSAPTAEVAIGGNQIHRHIATVSGNNSDKYISAATGRFVGCGVTLDGTAKCWGTTDEYYSSSITLGDNTNNKSYIPVKVHNSGPSGDVYTKITVGASSACGLTNDNRVMCWGTGNIMPSGASNSTVPVRLGTDFYKDLAYKYYHACAITTANKLHCWGYNGYGQLGDGTGNNSDGVPLLIDGGTDYKKVFVGESNTCAITSADALKCWGRNGRAQVGTGSTSGDITTPTLIDSGNSYLTVGIGAQHTCAITTANILKCWGDNWDNQVNHTNTNPVVTPYTIEVGRYKAVALGEEHTCALSVENDVYCWGNGGESGILGAGYFSETGYPVFVESDVKDISANYNQSCLIDQNDQLSCWGENQYGIIGNGQADTDHLTSTPDNLTTYSQTDGGEWHNCALGSDKKIRCNGNAWYGNIAQKVSAINNYAKAVEIPGLYKQVSSGTEFSCGISDPNNNLVCWGKIGTSYYHSPLILDGAVTYSSVSVGTDSACAITTSNVLKCWGLNDSGKLGINDTNEYTIVSDPTVVDSGVSYSSVSVGKDSACAIEISTGRVRCWGSQNTGLLGNGVDDYSNSIFAPIYTSDTSSYLKVKVGYHNACGILGTSPSTSGIVKCWGWGSSGQLGSGSSDRLVPTAITGGGNFIDITSGGYFSCGVDSSGVLKCWGDNNYGIVGGANLNTSFSTQQTVDSGTTYSSVAAGYAHFCGISTTGQLRCRGRNNEGMIGMGNLIARPSVVVPSN